VPEFSTAEIIPFPARPAADKQAARLARALAALDAAIAEQRTAVAAWRDSLTALRSSTAELSASAIRYHTSLGNLDAGLRQLNGQAQALERWADDTLARAPG